MSNKKVFGPSIVVLGFIAMVIVIIFPAKMVAKSTPDNGTLMGFVYGENDGVPLENAFVKIRCMGDRKEYQSGSTDKNGFFEIKGIEEGRYILGVTSNGEDFNFEYSILIKGRETGFLSFGLRLDVSDFEYEKIGGEEMGIEPFFPEPGGKAVFDTSVAESTMTVYSAMCPDPRCISWWKRFWRWLWWWLRMHGPRR